jgi:NADH-quinone oxidoreductase subunit C
MHTFAPLDPVEAMRAANADALVAEHHFRGDTTLVVTRESLVEVMLFLRNTPGLIYNFLSDISSVDYFPDPPTDARPERFAVSYHLYSMLYNRRVRVRVFVPEDDAVVPTILPVWPSANWLEREIAEMMGIRFAGHPDSRHLLLPEDWDGHPLRRDYPLGEEVVQFSFNAEEIMKHKPFAKE